MERRLGKLIFVSYLDRSGSTYFISRLGALKNVFAFPECEWIIDNVLVKEYRNFNELKEAFLISIHKDEKLKNWKFTQKEINSIFSQSKNKGEVFINLLNVYKNKYDKEAFVGVLKRQYILFYKNKILWELKDMIEIHWFSIIRNPIDVYASMKTTLDPYKGKPFEGNIISFFRRWHFSSGLIERNSDKVFFYEKFMTDTSEELKNISEILGINYSYDSKKITDFYNRFSEKDKMLHLRILKDSGSIEKNTKRKLSLLERLLIKLFLYRKKKYIHVNSLAKFIYFCVARFCKLKK